MNSTFCLISDNLSRETPKSNKIQRTSFGHLKCSQIHSKINVGCPEVVMWEECNKFYLLERKKLKINFPNITFKTDYNLKVATELRIFRKSSTYHFFANKSIKRLIKLPLLSKLKSVSAKSKLFNIDNQNVRLNFAELDVKH